ncbi:MAG TPA: hemerythrin domain-containing protein [Streptosporangiaceae bacterium]
MADVFEVLGADHADVKGMLTVLLESPGHEASDMVQEARQQVADYLVMDSSRHEAAEEQYFWPVVRERLPDGGRLADEAISQESEAKEMLTRLDKLTSRDPEFDRLIAEYSPAAQRHIEFEETRVWPALRAALTPDQAQDLGGKVEHAEDRGPTRPHPHTPPSPGMLRTAGAAVAVIDRLRDAMSGRGRTS